MRAANNNDNRPMMKALTVRYVITWSAALLLMVQAALAVAASTALAPDRIADVTNTKHNFSADAPDLLTGETRAVKASSQKEVCVFCHTPHFANTEVAAPLWNRALSTATYTAYDSSSMQADMSTNPQPGPSSKLCLSCHDGTLAIGSVNSAGGGANLQVDANGVITGVDPTTIEMSDGVTTMPAGTGLDTGFTRNLGTDLRNDHPIGFSYDSDLAGNDGELANPAAVTDVSIATREGRQAAGANAATRTHIAVPLENGKLECTSCHDPHIRGTNGDENKNIKFLRLNRFQKAVASDGSFSIASDMNCLACHRKVGWALSAHAHPDVANERYTSEAAQLRDFPQDLQVWEAGCLNCHDSHTVPGAPRLLREATDSTASPKQGGNAASEETCYQCHSPSGVLQDLTDVADIETPFKNSAVTKPIAGEEVHDVRDADLTEPQALLGKVSKGGLLSNRHVECTDCHNPHRMIKNAVFNGDASSPDAGGTHAHAAGTMHTNIASGVLRGTVGVEPIYNSAVFTEAPTDFDVKKGRPLPDGPGASEAVTADYVTREYQICLRCHSQYGFDTPLPELGHEGGTPWGTNGLTRYTDQAMEFQAPAGHEGDGVGAVNFGVAPGYENNNHRSWHPVMAPTGRAVVDAETLLAPFNQGLGQQTMYCSDCHGPATAPETVEPGLGQAWGPHGSNNPFLLTGRWDTNTSGNQSDGLCFQCHAYDQYANPAPAQVLRSGFSCADSSCITSPGNPSLFINLHVYHATAEGGGSTRCMDCHTAVPHGWKNKGLLVNLNDVGPEAGLSVGTAVTGPYSQQPYYLEARLSVNEFRRSGDWVKASCSGCHQP